jgi:hypothetical protein|tara:strand:+ start:750 stop:1046 length:297 start_codon:yes stop_codon:yes gene_type:complete
MYNEKEQMTRIKRLELNILIEMKKMATSSPESAKAAFNLTDEQVALFQKIQEANLMVLASRGNNMPFIETFNDEILKELTSEAFDVDFFEMSVDTIRG